LQVTTLLYIDINRQWAPTHTHVEGFLIKI